MLFFENCKYCETKLLYSSLYFSICLCYEAVQLDKVSPDFPALRQFMSKVVEMATESYSELIKRSLP